ncbi:MAG: hypothetical protein ACYCXK_09660 [Candidatus Humimicrobiaceae bacterium]
MSCQIKKDQFITTTETFTTSSGTIAEENITETSAEATTQQTTVSETTAAITPSTEGPTSSTFEYETNKIRIGGSAIGRYAITNEFSTTNEVRVLQHNEHALAEKYIKFCIEKNIFCIINIDFFVGSWQPSDAELRDFTISLKNQVKDWGGTKENVRFTVDNESDKWLDFNSYINYVRVVHDALNEEFDVGAGNFTSSNQAWYRSLAEVYPNGWFDVYDIHMQSGFATIEEINRNSEWFETIFRSFGISKRACTEANYNFDAIRDYRMIKLLVAKAQFLGLEDICFIYFDYIPNERESDMGMSFWLNGEPRDIATCIDFAGLIRSLKP